MGIGRSTLAEPVVARFPTAVGQQPSPRMTLWEDVGSSVEHGGGHHWLWRSVAAGQLLESRAREPYLHPSSSERVTTPGAFIPRGRIPDRAGCAIRPGLRGRWASRDAGEVAPRPPTYKERQRHIRRYGRANKHPGRGETPPSPARVFALWPAHPRAALEGTLTGRQPLRRGLCLARHSSASSSRCTTSSLRIRSSRSGWRFASSDR